MSCSVAVQVSPSSSLFHKPSSSSSSSPSPSSSSPSSPARLLRLHKPLLHFTSFITLSSSKDNNNNNININSVVSNASTSPSVSKRKRPSRLVIPVVSMGLGILDMDIKESGFGRELVEEEGVGYAVCCKRGRRETMEDRYSAQINIQGHNKLALFGVFDGHGGTKAAEFAAANLDKNIMDQLHKRGDDEIEVAVKEGYVNTDSQFLEQDSRGGSCCVTALIRNGNLVVSNAGDCRAVVSRDGVAEALTSDHRPSREDEKHRIESSGGYVDCRNGVPRILGSLAVSRGIGDQYLKQWVIAEPETRILRLKPELEFLILASDGLWDKVANQEAVAVVRDLYNGVEKPQHLLACKKLIDLSVSRGSSDDISVMLIQLTQFC